MSYQLRMLPEAADDANAIALHIAGKSIAGALRWLDAFEAAKDRIAKAPLTCGLAPEATELRREVRQALLETPSGSTYRAVFIMDRQTVTILRVRGRGQPPLEADEIDEPRQ